MKYREFVQLVRDGRIAELHVEPSNPQAFQYRVYVDGQDTILLDDDGRRICERSLGHARQRLRNAGGLGDIPLYLVQQSPGTIAVGGRTYSTANKTPLDLH